MKTNLMKTALMMLLAAFIGAQDISAQSIIGKPKPTPKPTLPVNNGGGKRHVTTNTDPMKGVTIISMKIGNVSYDGDMITYYGQTLYEGDMKYAKPQLTYNCKRTVSDVTVYSKIFRPNGVMITNSYSPDGYTTSDETDFITGTNMTVTLPGWETTTVVTTLKAPIAGRYGTRTRRLRQPTSPFIVVVAVME